MVVAADAGAAVVMVRSPSVASALDNDSLPMLRSRVRLLGRGGNPCSPLLAMLFGAHSTCCLSEVAVSSRPGKTRQWNV